MYHNLANLTLGGREKKYLGLEKAPGGAKAYKRSPKSLQVSTKKRGDRFFCFVETVKVLYGRQKLQLGAPNSKNGIVTPLLPARLSHITYIMVK